VSEIIVDTSTWINYFKGFRLIEIDLALEEGRVFTTGIIICEIISGVKNNQKRNQMISFFEELPMVIMNRQHWIRTGKLRAGLLKIGITISTPDAHIAQSCLDRGAYLMSEDRIFKRISKKISLKLNK